MQYIHIYAHACAPVLEVCACPASLAVQDGIHVVTAGPMVGSNMDLPK